jgi:alkylation response protein AidB-like acyl-CoA dehydrogenase
MRGDLEAALAVLEAHADAADASPEWPAASWDALIQAGVPRWVIPSPNGGDDWSAVDVLDGYGRLAGACLTTCFLLSQRDAACRRLRDSGNEALCQELFPPLARGETFATVGISQLTTSRQHVKPVLAARLESDRVCLNGRMPWVTGAARADFFVTGAVCEDGRQVLLVVPRDAPGLRIGPPLALRALQGSLTAEVRCEEVILERKWLLAGPAERVLAANRGAGGLETSALALGLTSAAITYLRRELERRPELLTSAEACDRTRRALHGEMHRLARSGGTPEEAARLRARANSLVLRTTQTALAAAKGTGFVRPHSAGRWAHQALFFLVWSCPRPALDATLTYLAPPGEG